MTTVTKESNVDVLIVGAGPAGYVTFTPSIPSDWVQIDWMPNYP
jgi:hypothetical protein